MIDTSKTWDQLRGDGRTQPCTPEQLTLLKTEFKQICTDAGHSVNDRRELGENTRFNRWAGQSLDGKKHKAAMNGAEAFPFEGASDARVRTADDITNEQVIIMMAALMRQQLGFKGTESNDDELAGNLSVLWQWVLKNQLGSEWFVEWTKFAQWRQGDSPAVGVMQVYWHQERSLCPVDTTTDEVTERLLEAAAKQQMQISPEDSADLQDLAINPERRDEYAGLLQTLWPDLPDKTAKRAAGELQQTGESTFPYPYISENRLRIKARRLFEDIFIPENTTDIRRARMIVVREWFTATELREMEAAGDFKPGFVDEVLKHEGETGWAHYCHFEASGDYSEGVITRTWDKNRQRGQYELLTAFYQASNADGVPGTYTVQFHANVDIPGTDQELFDYKLSGRRYPFVISPREILSDKLWDSRGNSELSMTEQASLKLLHDSFMDHAQLCTVPPIKVPAARPKMQLVIGPLKQIKENRPGEISFMTMPTYPQSNDKMQSSIMAGLDRYFGRMSATNPPDLVRLYQQSLVDFFLLPVAEVVRMGGQLCQQFMDDATLARITGEQGKPIARSIEEIAGQFDVEVSFEAGMLSFDYLKAIGEMISKYVLTWDTLNTVQRDELVNWFFSALSPSLAKRLVKPVASVNQSEIADEQNNFAKIAAGIEPPMAEDGQNFKLRLDTLMEIGAKNPEAFAKLTPASRAILSARVKHFQGMLEQQQNAVIGRTMASPALPMQEPPSAESAA